MSNEHGRTRGAESIYEALEPVAGNGLLDRRALLGSGIALAGAIGAGASPTAPPRRAARRTRRGALELGAVTPTLRRRRASRSTSSASLSNPQGEPRTPHARTPHHLLNGTITPNSLHFVISHSGIPTSIRTSTAS